MQHSLKKITSAKRRQDSCRGFTLVELITVIAIIGILTAIVTANLADSRARARDSQRIADVERIALALETYRQAYGEYPTEGAAMNGIVGEGAGVDAGLLPIMGSVPHDPLGPGDSEYQYYYDGDHDCSTAGPGVSQAVVFAVTMEREGRANWSDVCGGPASEGTPDENTYMVLVGDTSD